MSKRNGFIYKAIQTLCWLIFAGLCVQTGALLFNFIYSLFRPVATHNLHLGLDLSQLYEQSLSLYILLFGLLLALSALKAVVFYFVLRLFKKLTLTRPFTATVAGLVTTISSVAFSVGALSYLAHQFTQRLTQKGYGVNQVERYWNDSDAYFMMAAILFAIALVLKRGIELQQETDLTV
ncbi:MAG TPA: hypothetical protein PKE63_05390 [Lacibacter sp.]|nr:hypothetical protein [Lacibacter sp.]HMO88844.1 hypothetical protein [Lacibacter sp.]HMP86689.1 hypothetical protein [Lacibacter sp.]